MEKRASFNQSRLYQSYNLPSIVAPLPPSAGFMRFASLLFSTFPLTPVEPKPPAPREVSLSSSTSTTGAMQMRSRMSWATL